MTSEPITIYQLRVAMADITPPIWRVIEVPADFSLDWLHDVIQWSMGWEHEHAYRFHRRETGYVADPEAHEPELARELDATYYTLQKVYGKRGRYLRYVYDMDDSWWHHVWLEDSFLAAEETAYPRLVDGRRAAPPEGFGGITDYKAFLRGELADDDPRLELFADFDPDQFGTTPRPFPNARIYRPGQTPAPPERPTTLAPLAVEMLDDLREPANEVLEHTDHEFCADLRRAIEDIAIADDALPPKTADTLQRARTEGTGIKDFLLRCVQHHRQLSQTHSTAPFHAAHLLAYWKIPEAIDVFADIVRQAPDEEVGTVETMIDALIWSGKPGIETLLEMLDELSDTTRNQAMVHLCREGITDDRLFDHLRDAIKHAGPSEARIPLLLSQYDDERAVDLLLESLDDELQFLTTESGVDDEQALHADYALFLTEMLAASGQTLDEERWNLLDDIEEFYWPSPAFKKRLRRD